MSRLAGTMTNTSQGSRMGAAGYMAIGLPVAAQCPICKGFHNNKSNDKCSKAKQAMFLEQKIMDKLMGWAA